MGKKKVQQSDDDYGKLDMSSMIDCCFLLLIFFIVNATALTVSKDPSVTMPQATKPTDLEDAKGCIVVNVFAPAKMLETVQNGSTQDKKNEEARIRKMKESYKCQDITKIIFGVKTSAGEMKFFSADGLKDLEAFIKDEKKAMETMKVEAKQIRIYVRADARADWRYTHMVIAAANNAGISDIVFGNVPAKK
ncbi:MAG: hypothetical protein E7031_06100 [Akkermansiaceae bacterium]|nr:hypothetical protein [Akkermansiaceae bacterium]